MRKWLYRFHLYGGLLCFPYLIIFGFSSLNFNHHFAFTSAGQDSVSWEEAVRVPPIADDVQQAEALRDSLSLMGWTPPWVIKHDSLGVFTFGLARPGKYYLMHYDPQRNFVKVEETRFGFWRVFDSLHALEHIPRSRFSYVWRGFTEVCGIFGMLAGISGIVLWAKSRREKMSGLLVVLGASGISILFMLFVWLRG